MVHKLKNVLITGSGGFIGGNVKTYLEGKYNLLYPRSYELNLCNDIAVSDFFQHNDIDCIIHCSTVGGVRNVADKDTTIDDNLAMVDNILNNKKTDCRVILFGSGAMYDRFRDLHKVKESEIGKRIPSELYGKSKMLIAEKIKNRDDVICLNIFGCYGKNEKTTRFPTYAILQNLRHLPIEINQNVIFDYLYVDDLCKIIEFFIENKPQNNILNLTPTQSITLFDIAKTVNSISEYKSEIIIKNNKMNYEYTADNSLLLKELGGKFEFTGYNKGIKTLYEQLKNND